MMNKIQDIKKYYIWQFISGFYFVYTIQAIYLLEKGISAGELAIFASINAITTTITEIPTGYIADKFSRKFSISLGFLIQGIANILIIFSDNIFILIPVGILLGIGNSLLSGSVESFLYDMLKNHNDEKSYLKVSSKASAIGTITGTVATFIGPIIFIVNRELPFILTGIALFVLSILVYTIKETRLESKEVRRNVSIWDGVRNIISTKAILIITLVDTVLLVIVNLFYQVINFPKLQSLGFPIEFLGTLDFVNLILMTLMLLVISKLIFKSQKYTLFLYSIGTSVVFAFYYMASNLLSAIILSIIFDIVWSARKQIIPTITNRYFSSKNRATSISSMSLVSNLGASIFVPIMLKMLDLNAYFVFLPVLLTMFLFFVYPNGQKHKRMVLC